MLVVCPFCRQILIQAYKHLRYEYAVCFPCFKKISIEYRLAQFQRLSLLGEQGNYKVFKVKKINQELKTYLDMKSQGIQQRLQPEVTQEYFQRYLNVTKSQFSDTSTSPSQCIQGQQNCKQKPKIQKQVNNNSTVKQESKALLKLFQIKDKLATTGSNIIQKLKQSEQVEKQVENINCYKQKILDKGSEVKSKLSKWKKQFCNITAEMPPVNQALQNLDLKQKLVSKFWKKW